MYLEYQCNNKNNKSDSLYEQNNTTILDIEKTPLQYWIKCKSNNETVWHNNQ